MNCFHVQLMQAFKMIRAKMAKTVTLKDMAGDAIMCLMLKTNYYNIYLIQYITLFILLIQIKL